MVKKLEDITKQLTIKEPSPLRAPKPYIPEPFGKKALGEYIAHMTGNCFEQADFMLSVARGELALDREVMGKDGPTRITVQPSIAEMMQAHVWLVTKVYGKDPDRIALEHSGVVKHELTDPRRLSVEQQKQLLDIYRSVEAQESSIEAEFSISSEPDSSGEEPK